MAIDKALNPAPLGLPMGGMSPSSDDRGGSDLEIEIEDPESVDIHAGPLNIHVDPDASEEDNEFAANLAEDMDEGALTELAGDLLGEFDEDISSRKDWIQTYVDGLDRKSVV